MLDIVRFDKFNLLVELEQTYIKLATKSSSKEEHKKGRGKREEKKGRVKINWKARKLFPCLQPDLRRKKEKSSQSKGTSDGDEMLPSSSAT